MKRSLLLFGFLLLGLRASALDIVDEFGYQLTGRSFSYTEISSTGSSVNTWTGGSDDGYFELSLPFNYSFYASVFNKVTIVTNGYIQFGLSPVFSSPNCLSSNLAPNDIAAAYFIDLNPGAGGAVYTQINGTAPNRVAIIEFQNVPLNSGGGTVSFQYLLYETSNDLEVRYLSTSSAGSGLGASVGLRSLFDCPNHTALSYSCGSATLGDNLDFYYAYPVPEPACGSPTNTPSFTISPTSTPSFSVSPTFSISPSFSTSPTPSPSTTASPSDTDTFTMTASPSVTASPSITATPTPTRTLVALSDAFGYSASSTLFNWVDISGTGTPATWIDGSDDGYEIVSLPNSWNFRFYGTNYDKVSISSNGYLQFGTFSSNFSNSCLNTNLSPNEIIALFWEDLNPGAGGTVYTETLGSSPNQIFVVEFDNVATNLGGTVSCEALLFQSDNHISLRYQDTSTVGSGIDAAVGLRSLFDCPNRTGLSISCNEADIGQQSQIDISYPSPEPACGSPTYTPSASNSPSSTPSPTDSPTASPSASPSPSPTISPSFTVSPSATPSPSITLTPTISPSFTISSTFTVSPTITETGTISPTFSVSPSFSVSPTISPSFSASPSATVSPTISATLTASGSPSPSFTASPTPSTSATLTSSPTITLSATQSATFTITLSATPSDTPTYSATPSATPTITLSATPSDTPTYSATPSATPTITLTGTPTDTPTVTPTYTASPSFTLTPYPPAVTPACLVLGQVNLTSSAATSAAASGISQPEGLAIDLHSSPYRVYVADANYNRILIWNDAATLFNGEPADGVIGQVNLSGSSVNAGGSVSSSGLNSPTGIAVDDSDGDLWVADSSNNRVLRFAAPIPLSGATASTVIGQAGSFTNNAANLGGVSASSLNGPSGLAIDGNRNMIVADSFNNRVLRYSLSGVSTTANMVWGQLNFGGSLPNQGGSTNAFGLFSPSGVAISSSYLFVSDYGNNRVLGYSFFPPTTTAQVLMGQTSFSGNSSNFGFVLPASDSLSKPLGLAMDVTGRLYVADSGNNRVLGFDPPYSNTPDYLFGQTSYGANGAAVSSNGLNVPSNAQADVTGSLLLADSSSHRILIYGCGIGGGIGIASPSPSVSPTKTPTPSFSKTPTATPSFSDSPSYTPSASFTLSASFTNSPTQSATATISATLTISPTLSPTSTVTSTSSATRSPTKSPTPNLEPTTTPFPHPSSQILSYPNPVSHGAAYVSLAFPQGNQARIEIYDLLFEKVREYDGISAAAGWAHWDLRNDAGQGVAPGIYFLRITIDGSVYMSKMTVY